MLLKEQISLSEEACAPSLQEGPEKMVGGNKRLSKNNQPLPYATRNKSENRRVAGGCEWAL